MRLQLSVTADHTRRRERAVMNMPVSMPECAVCQYQAHVVDLAIGIDEEGQIARLAVCECDFPAERSLLTGVPRDGDAAEAIDRLGEA